MNGGAKFGHLLAAFLFGSFWPASASPTARLCTRAATLPTCWHPPWPWWLAAWCITARSRSTGNLISNHGNDDGHAILNMMKISMVAVTACSQIMLSCH